MEKFVDAILAHKYGLKIKQIDNNNYIVNHKKELSKDELDEFLFIFYDKLSQKLFNIYAIKDAIDYINRNKLNIGMKIEYILDINNPSRNKYYILNSIDYNLDILDTNILLKERHRYCSPIKNSHSAIVNKFNNYSYKDYDVDIVKTGDSIVVNLNNKIKY